MNKLLCCNRFKLIVKAVECLYIHIDTNATHPFKWLLEKIPELNIVICLSEKSDHNAKRSGSFDYIVNNLKAAADVGLSPIVICYNVLQDNITNFERFLKSVRTNSRQIQAVSTARIDDSGCDDRSVNKIKHQDFALWNATTAIEIRI